ncbi:UNVERIFIED_CONTAM: hypothetical protein Scaly_0996900 [Sesamum calycinum]|uniref:Uncharacterized protein n=1 Tax=Sesamum calycinum TaxID=2727403 RepID=A0AAW2QZ80_9LAMI
MFPRIHGDPTSYQCNPAKIKAILDMGPPTNINEVQRLIGRMAALSRFISKSAKKGLPFFKTLRKIKVSNGSKNVNERLKNSKRIWQSSLCWVQNQYSSKASPKQNRSIWAISKERNRVERIRHLVPTSNDNQGLGIGRFRI